MSTMKKIVLIVTCVLAVCVLGAAVSLAVAVGQSGGAPGWKNLTKGTVVQVDESAPLDLGSVKSINIENMSGRIVVAPGEPRVTLTGRVTTSLNKKEFLEVKNAGGSLTVRTDLYASFPNFINGNLVLTVYLPEDLGLDASVSGASSTVDVSGIRFGSLSVSSTSGSVKVIGCEGSTLKAGSTSGEAEVRDVRFDSIDISSTSGDVKVSGAEGSLTASCTSGSIEVSDVSGAVDVSNTSGGASVTLRQTPLQPVRIDCISGSIRLELNPSAAFDLDVDIGSGGFSSEFDITVSGKKPGKVTGEDISGKVNGGGEPVKLSTVSGSIDLVKAE